MPMYALPPVPPPPPAIVQCTTADGHVVPQCAKYDYKHAGSSVSARFSGDVRIELKSAEVVNVPAGGSAVIEERTGSSSRRFSIEDGRTSYVVNGVEHPFDAAARQWLRDVLRTMPERPVPPAKPSK